MAANENLDQYLPQTRKIALFGYLTDQELQGILEHAEIVHYPEGEKIVSQDEVSEYLFAIIKGMVKVTVQYRRRRSIWRGRLIYDRETNGQCD